MLKSLKIFCLLMAGLLATAAGGEAEEKQKPEDPLAHASIEKCKQTHSDGQMPTLIVKKVEAACKLIEKQGPACFDKFEGCDSEFIFCGTYMAIHTLEDSVVKMHPIKHRLVGRSLAKARDGKGKPFFAEINQMAEKKGQGWVEYYWPKPGEKDLSVKATYVDLAQFEDVKYVITCGIYDMTLKDVTTALKTAAEGCCPPEG